MYTQCSKCTTVFRLSADLLRVADGQVRCGRCGEVFNALASLAEHPDAFAAGESPLELETRADQILDNPPAEPAPQEPDTSAFGPLDPADVQIAQLEFTDDSPPIDEGELEFTLPPGELDRIFVEAKRMGQGWPPFAPAAMEPPPPATTPAPPPVEPAPPPVEPAPFPVEPAPPPVEPAPPPVEPAPPPVEPAPVHEGEPADHEPSTPPAATEVDEELRAAARAAQIASELEEAVAKLAPPENRHALLWLGAAVLLLLTLGAQAVHHNREWLVAHTRFGPALRMIYAKLGDDLPVPENLAAYQLRQWGVTGDAGAHGTLRVRASILNTAAAPLPYPLLRVTLTDRYGHDVGERDFSPSEYLGKPAASWMAPGMRADTTIDIVDPGKDAEGFEIDVCLRGEKQKVYCEDDAAAHGK